MSPNQLQGKTIAYACFDWGFGHVTRSISILNQLQEQQNRIIFIGSKSQVDFVLAYFPKIEYRIWSVPALKFSGSGNFVYEGFRNFFRIRKIWSYEKRYLETLIGKENIDIVLSDHRYGFRSSKVPSVFITHQFNLPVGTPKLIRTIHRKKLELFDSFWIIDNAPGEFSGALTEGILPSNCIGIRSRFELYDPAKNGTGIVVVLSGPEPYAKQLYTLFQESIGTTITVLANFPKPSDCLNTIHWIEQGKVNQKEIDAVLCSCEWIISRNGYSTRMDIAILGKKALLLATPGQLEQIYLCSLQVNPNVRSFVQSNEFREAVKELFDSYST